MKKRTAGEIIARQREFFNMLSKDYPGLNLIDIRFDYEHDCFEYEFIHKEKRVVSYLRFEHEIGKKV